MHIRSKCWRNDRRFGATLWRAGRPDPSDNGRASFGVAILDREPPTSGAATASGDVG
jgi:hypothetical protein